MHLPFTVDLIAIVGPTAVGKTALAAHLAGEFNGEIISADSRQVYKRMDIGTGKDLSDYIVNGEQVPYHLIDIAEPSEEYNLYKFRTDFSISFKQIKERGKIAILAGGTGLYLSAVIQNYNLIKADDDIEFLNQLNSFSDERLKRLLLELRPVQHNTTDMIDRQRIINAICVAKAEDAAGQPDPLKTFVLGINPGRKIVKERITARLKHRLKNGMIEEVQNLVHEGIDFERLNLLGLEYRYISLYLLGQLNYNDMYQKLNSAIHAFAKRQMTWFRKMEKEGVVIHWLDTPDFNMAKDLIVKHCIN